MCVSFFKFVSSQRYSFFRSMCQIHLAHSFNVCLCPVWVVVLGGTFRAVFYFPQTVAITINRCAISATRCNKSGAMRAKFSLAKSHDGKICTTYAACSLPGAGIFTIPAACFCCKYVMNPVWRLVDCCNTSKWSRPHGNANSIQCSLSVWRIQENYWYISNISRINWHILSMDFSAYLHFSCNTFQLCLLQAHTLCNS